MRTLGGPAPVLALCKSSSAALLLNTLIRYKVVSVRRILVANEREVALHNCSHVECEKSQVWLHDSFGDGRWENASKPI